jgi:hypothetical protein
VARSHKKRRQGVLRGECIQGQKCCVIIGSNERSGPAIDHVIADGDGLFYAAAEQQHVFVWSVFAIQRDAGVP